MTITTPADKSDSASHDRFSRMTVLKLFALIVLVTFVLRIVYAGHFYEDDGLWFTAGEEILRGKALYREIYFDKPPGLALLYALLFAIFGAHIMTIRLFAIAYSVAISAVLYLMGARMHDKRTGLLAAAMFAVFSTTYPQGHTQGFATDLAMMLPYAGAAYFVIVSRLCDKGRAWHALIGGALSGVAFQINPKGIFDLVFLIAFLITARKWCPVDSPASNAVARAETKGVLKLVGLVAAGFVVGVAPFLAYVAASRSLHEYWSYVWEWGIHYSAYNPVTKIARNTLTRTADYFGLNNLLLFTLIFLLVYAIRRWRHFIVLRKDERLEQAPGADFKALAKLRMDAVWLLWFAVSFAGVLVGGRFYGHYFVQLLPALCLIGARGLTSIQAALRGRSLFLRRAVALGIIAGFAFTLVRFHGRGVLLTADLIKGQIGKADVSWPYIMRDHEERIIAAKVRDFDYEPDAVDHLGLEALRVDGPRTRTPAGPSDYLFVWGYRPEIYFWSGLIPASRFLSSQPVTGVPADVNYFMNDYRRIIPENVTAEAREQLLRDLNETKPKYIIDELGFFNSDLAMPRYPELKEFLKDYKPLGSVERFLVYIRRDLTKKHLRRGY